MDKKMRDRIREVHRSVIMSGCGIAVGMMGSIIRAQVGTVSEPALVVVRVLAYVALIVRERTMQMIIRACYHMSYDCAKRENPCWDAPSTRDQMRRLAGVESVREDPHPLEKEMFRNTGMDHRSNSHSRPRSTMVDHGRPMVDPWSTPGRPWSTHDRPWSTDGRPMVDPRSTHGRPMDD